MNGGRILILGVNGMLGHTLYAFSHAAYSTYGTLQGDFSRVERFGIFERAQIVGGVTVQNFDSVIGAFERVKPDVVVNCIGAIKQSAAAQDPIQSITVNALFPHQVAKLCALSGARLIHISTDCVFSGKQGHYTETDIPDPEDLYGRSKLMGEVSGAAHALTIRTSMIGYELSTQYGLVEWFLSNRGKTVKGFRQAIFSGLTTAALSEAILYVIAQQPTLSGLVHISAAPIDKFHLLQRLNEALNTQIEIVPEDEPRIDRSLDSSAFRRAAGWTPPTWESMIDALKNAPHIR